MTKLGLESDEFHFPLGVLVKETDFVAADYSPQLIVICSYIGDYD